MLMVGERKERNIIAIVGSRDLTPEQASVVRAHCLVHLAEVSELVSGGARGVDTIAEKAAKDLNIHCSIVRPANPSIKRDYILRNHKIVDYADKVIAFWDGKSKGTQSVIKYCEKNKKELLIIRIIKTPRWPN